jgi:predicted transposase/invertase (TIGR01784 family)
MTHKGDSMQPNLVIKDDFLMSRKNDYVFKRLFGDENNKDILLALLNSILRENIVDVQILNPEFAIEFEEDKLGILDVKARTDSGTFIDIEIQLSRTIAFEKRILYYWSKLYSGVLKKGDPYDKLEKTVSICIVDYLRFSDNLLHHQFYIYDTEASIRLTDILEIHFLELKKLEKLNTLDFTETKSIDELTPMEQWLTFIATDDRRVLKMLSEKNKEIKKAFELVDVMSQSEVDRRAYEAREASLHYEATIKQGYYKLGREEGKAEGKEEGREEGKEEGKEEIALKVVRNALSKGFTPEEVADITGISVDEQKRLMNL